MEHLVWEQKYRPRKIEDVILPPATTKLVAEMVKTGNLTNCLFSGPGGIGKTTLARAIADQLGADLLYINASMDGNMDTLRTTITQFVSSMSFTDSKKIVLLDEFDAMTSVAQAAFRGFCDEFSKNATFIGTCNNKSRIIDPLLSRMTEVDFSFSKEEKSSAATKMLKRACYILEQESVEYDKAAVAAVVTKNFPDFRKTIVELQRYSAGGCIDSGILSLSPNTDIEQLITLIKEKNFSKCRQWVANNTMDNQTFYRGLYDTMMPLLVPQTIPPLILTIAESQYRGSHAVDPEINRIACIIQIMSVVAFK